MSLLVLLIAGLLSPSVWAETNSERVVVLDFLTLDENGNYIDTLALKHTDLVNLSRIMSQGIAARLVQYGEFDVLDSISLRDEINSLGFTYETSAYERAQVLLESESS